MSIYKMNMYKVGSFTNFIETVTIERVSEQSVWAGGRRYARASKYEKYFETYEQAKNYLLDKAERKLDMAKKSLSYAEEMLKEVQAL